MTKEFTIDTGEDEILVEFAPRPGVRQVSLAIGPQELAGKSARALDKAMSTIRQMAHRVTEAVRSIEVVDRPTKVELEFGIKLDAEAGAYIAKVSTEAGFKVVLTWKRSEETE
ncbi:MAG: CU044_2847 family protein [Anaerolineae bacterium]